MTKMDKHGDRYSRRNGRWVKITKQPAGGYSVVRGYEGDFKCAPNGITINHTTYQWAKDAAASWLDSN